MIERLIHKADNKINELTQENTVGDDYITVANLTSGEAWKLLHSVLDG